jgi:HlyD family secretion protein
VRRKLWIPALVLIVIAALVIVNLLKSDSGAVQVRAEEAAFRSLETWVRAPGWIQPVVSVDISSNVTGRVDRLHVREGERVCRGELLLTLDDTKFRSAVDQYEAMLRAARSQLTLAEAQRDLATQLLARREDLFAGGLLSSEELETARVDLRVGAAQVDAQGEEIDRLRAALTEVRRDLEETRFHAPMDGVVTALNLEEGENVLIGTMNAPGTVILTVSDLSQMEVEARVNEGDVVLVGPGQEVRIEVDAKPEDLLAGKVTSVGQSGARLSKEEGAEFEVCVEILDPPGWLKPGMSADVEVLTAHVDSALSVPIQVLVARAQETVRKWEWEDEGASEDSTVGGAGEAGRRETDAPRREDLIEGVFVIAQKKAGFRRVTTGIRGEQYLEILSGLEEGEGTE